MAQYSPDDTVVTITTRRRARRRRVIYTGLVLVLLAFTLAGPNFLALAVGHHTWSFVP